MYEVRVTPIEENSSKLIGLATVVVDGSFVFSGIKLLMTDNYSANKGRGYNVVMPSYKNSYGEYVDFFMPVTKQMYDELTYAIDQSLKSGEIVTFGQEKLPVAVRVKENTNKSNGAWAIATVAFNKEFVCDTIQVRESKTGNLFVAYPSYRTNKTNENGDPIYQNVCNPITKDFKQELDSRILDKLFVKKQGVGEMAESGFSMQRQERKTNLNNGSVGKNHIK